jgi:1-deoxy-D-xylulose-5-phosphate reductoisomerase
VGPQAAEEVAERTDADVMVCAVPGIAALPGVLAGARRGLKLAMASKEVFVAAGEIIMDTAARHGARIIPIDSEHCAIHQALDGRNDSWLRKVVLTASGGPFLNVPAADLKNVSPSQALAHPTWAMGPKTTIDSGTMMNKALEIVEARCLFDLNPEAIDVVVHPEAIVHSMVEFSDGTVLAQMSVPDMRLPILYALYYPERAELALAPLDLTRVGALTFREADANAFPALGLGFEVARRKGTLGAVMNAADERAVSLFLDGRISFDRICPLVAEVMSRHEVVDSPDLEQILDADRWAREEVLQWI